VQVKGNRRPGFLCVGADRARRFGPHEVELLEMLASLTAGAVANARLFAAVARAKLEWERTFDSIADPIFVTDNAFRVVRLNRAAAACFELPLKEAAGRLCYEVITGERGGMCPWHDALRDSRSVCSDRYLARLDRWFSFSAFPFEDEGGNRVGVVHVLKDVTEDRKLRAQIVQSAQKADPPEMP
jgi:PAS domain S-box-containing protein